MLPVAPHKLYCEYICTCGSCHRRTLHYNIQLPEQKVNFAMFRLSTDRRSADA